MATIVTLQPAKSRWRGCLCVDSMVDSPGRYRLDPNALPPRLPSAVHFREDPRLPPILVYDPPSTAPGPPPDGNALLPNFMIHHPHMSIDAATLVNHFTVNAERAHAAFEAAMEENRRRAAEMRAERRWRRANGYRDGGGGGGSGGGDGGGGDGGGGCDGGGE